MGNENVVKDPNIQLFLQLKRHIYQPGQILKGCIYLEVKEYSKYSDLILRLECFEKTQYKNKKDKNNQFIVEERRTYFDQMKIAEFLNGLYQGQHQFPFNLKIPQQFPGSLVLGLNDYIRYRLTVYMQSNSAQITNQLHSRQIWIQQKFRHKIQPLFSRNQQQPKCCMWGYSWGWVKTQLELQTNYVEPGQKVKLKFQINTLRMNADVKNTKIRFVQKNILITNEYFEQKQINQLFSFDFNQLIIQKGQTRKIQKQILLPLDIQPSVIGQIISRFYVIEVILSFACNSQLKQEVHVFVLSNKNGLKQENKPFAKPKKWKPTKYQKLEFNKLKSYQYKPDSKIRFKNQIQEQLNKFEIMKITEPSSTRRIQI